MLNRSLEKSKPVIEEIQKETGNEDIEVVECDLADLKSVERAAKEVLKKCKKLGGLHMLINNAGIMVCVFLLAHLPL